MAEFLGGDGHRDFDELSISSTDRRAEREDDSDTGGLVESLLFRLGQIMRAVSSLGRVCVQQQFLGQHRDAVV